MKIRFLKTIGVDIETPKHEVWSKTFNKWTELLVDEIFVTSNQATIKTYDGNFILNVPISAFEKVKDDKPLLSFL
jgi:hypothetical protein